jgi:enoyl-CoA hydratase
VGELVRLEIDGAVGTIRLDRPKMNAIDHQLCVELLEVVGEVRDNPSIRAAVLYGG